MKKNVCIADIGIVSSIGNSLEETYQSILLEETGIQFPKLIDTLHSHLPVGEIKITDNGLSTKLTLSISTKSGITNATGGSSIIIKVLIRNVFLNRILEAEITKPAREAVIVAITTIAAL